jgi:hypothetical protein
MAIRLRVPLIAVVLGLSLAHAKPVAAADLWTAAQNFVNKDIEADKFDSSGLQTDGFYLHTFGGNIGAGYFSDLAFDPAGHLGTADQNFVNNDIEVDKFDARGLLTNGFYLHTSGGNIGAGYFSAFDFAPSAAAAAPEPATWSMMMIGFGVFAAISWRHAGLQRRKA